MKVLSRVRADVEVTLAQKIEGLLFRTLQKLVWVCVSLYLVSGSMSDTVILT